MMQDNMNSRMPQCLHITVCQAVFENVTWCTLDHPYSNSVRLIPSLLPFDRHRNWGPEKNNMPVATKMTSNRAGPPSYRVSVSFGRCKQLPPTWWLKTQIYGTFLVVYWLRRHLPVQRVQVWSLVGQLGPHRLHSQKNQNIKQKQYCNKFNKDFKNGLHQFSSKKHWLPKSDCLALEQPFTICVYLGKWLSSLCLSFFICKMEVIPQRIFVRIKWLNPHSTLRRVSGTKWAFGKCQSFARV